MNKLSYLVRSIVNYPKPKICPYCKSRGSSVIDRKWLVTTLNRCDSCKLQFRHPVDTVAFNKKFYQKVYRENDGITTDLPDKDQLEKWMATNFKASPKDYSNKIEMLLWLAGPCKILDYGASWGYASYQMKQAGFDVKSYDISKPRAAFGKQLGLDIATDENMLADNLDIFFSAHVIEHLPDIKHLFNLAKKLLKPGGYFVAYCPNGSETLCLNDPLTHHRLWGEVHPYMISDEFYKQVFHEHPYFIGTEHTSMEEIKSWDKKSQQCSLLTGVELFIVAKL